MVIRPMIAAYTLGEMGRPATNMGGSGGPASLFKVKDMVSLGGGTPGAGLYTGTTLFKIIGAVELMTDDHGIEEEPGGFADHPVLL